MQIYSAAKVLVEAELYKVRGRAAQKNFHITTNGSRATAGKGHTVVSATPC